MCLATFENIMKGTVPVYVGDFLCYLSNHTVHALNLATNTISTIDLKSLIEGDSNLDKKAVFLDACEPRSLVLSGLVSC